MDWLSCRAKLTGSIIDTDGQEGVFAGGTDIGATVNAGGALFINAGGKGISATLSGIASTSTTSGLGAEVVSAGGRTSNTSILSGGVEIVSHGGLAVSTSVQNDGVGPTAGGLVLLARQAAVRRARPLSIVAHRKRSSPAVPTLALRSTVAACSSCSLGGRASGHDCQRRLGGCRLRQRRCFLGRRSGCQNHSKSGGVLAVHSGGRASGTQITSGGVEVVSAGGTGIAATLTGNEDDDGNVWR